MNILSRSMFFALTFFASFFCIYTIRGMQEESKDPASKRRKIDAPAPTQQASDEENELNKCFIKAIEAGDAATVKVFLLSPTLQEIHDGLQIEEQGQIPLELCNIIYEFAHIDPNMQYIRLDDNTQEPVIAYPLLTASLKGHTEIVQLLLDAKANPDICDATDKNAPLHFAACFGHTAIVQKLLIARANPNAQNCAGRTPLHFAVYSDPKIVELLLQYGANPFIKCYAGPWLITIRPREFALGGPRLTPLEIARRELDKLTNIILESPNSHVT